MLTARQRQVLLLIQDDLVQGRKWDNRVLSSSTSRQPGQQLSISWEEMKWVSELERQGLASRISAILLVDEVRKREIDVRKTGS